MAMLCTTCHIIEIVAYLPLGSKMNNSDPRVIIWPKHSKQQLHAAEHNLWIWPDLVPGMRGLFCRQDVVIDWSTDHTRNDIAAQENPAVEIRVQSTPVRTRIPLIRTHHTRVCPCSRQPRVEKRIQNSGRKRQCLKWVGLEQGLTDCRETYRFYS